MSCYITLTCYMYDVGQTDDMNSCYYACDVLYYYYYYYY